MEPKSPRRNRDHFDKIFWLLVSCVAVAFIYIFLITFLHIPKENIRFADTAQGFFLATVIGGGIGYYIGSSPSQQKNDQPPGSTTADVSATITTTTETPES
jgi:hypothetical protein